MGKVLAWMQPFVFQVYIIHLHPFVWNGIILSGFTHFAKKAWYTLPLWVGGAALMIFLVCMSVDIFRHYLFKYTGVYRCIEWVSNKLNFLYGKSKLKLKMDKYFE